MLARDKDQDTINTQLATYLKLRSSNQLATYLKLRSSDVILFDKARAEKLSDLLMDDGFCFCFSVCHGAMRIEGKLPWWDEALDKILNWDETDWSKIDWDTIDWDTIDWDTIDWDKI